ncbi:hypothetical protein HDV05_003693 [Chytridiales sp. JEL 0842]|nr:hypothetical protein HDV05_003693 [Chytridiales sp. JEL 0842]
MVGAVSSNSFHTSLLGLKPNSAEAAADIPAQYYATSSSTATPIRFQSLSELLPDTQQTTTIKEASSQMQPNPTRVSTPTPISSSGGVDSVPPLSAPAPKKSLIRQFLDYSAVSYLRPFHEASNLNRWPRVSNGGAGGVDGAQGAMGDETATAAENEALNVDGSGVPEPRGPTPNNNVNTPGIDMSRNGQYTSPSQNSTTGKNSPSTPATTRTAPLSLSVQKPLPVQPSVSPHHAAAIPPKSLNILTGGPPRPSSTPPVLVSTTPSPKTPPRHLKPAPPQPQLTQTQYAQPTPIRIPQKPPLTPPRYIPPSSSVAAVALHMKHPANVHQVLPHVPHAHPGSVIHVGGDGHHYLSSVSEEREDYSSSPEKVQKMTDGGAPRPKIPHPTPPRIKIPGYSAAAAASVSTPPSAVEKRIIASTEMKPTVPKVVVEKEEDADNNGEETMAQKMLKGHTLVDEFVERYNITCELGTGGFGFVCGAIRADDGLEVAVKFILKTRVPSTSWARDRDLGVVPMEVYILKNINHPNVINYIDCFHDSKYIYLITEMHGSQWNAPNPSSLAPKVTPTSTPQLSAQWFPEKTIQASPISMKGSEDSPNESASPSYREMGGCASPRPPKHAHQPTDNDEQRRRLVEMEQSAGKKACIGTDYPGDVARASSTKMDIKDSVTTATKAFVSPPLTPVGGGMTPSGSRRASQEEKRVGGGAACGDIDTTMATEMDALQLKEKGGGGTKQGSPSVGGPTPNRDLHSVTFQPPPLTRAQTFPLLTKLSRRPSMDLFECIEQNDWLPEDRARVVFAQVAKAVMYLHSRGVVHRDIKDENIVIDSNYYVKLIDFGSAAVEPKGHPNCLFDRFYGTVQYASPEILRGEQYRGRATDVWAMGVLLYTILFGEVPFATSEQATSAPFKSPRFKIHPEALKLIAWMLEKDPRKRPTAEQVYMHPWIRKGRQH